MFEQIKSIFVGLFGGRRTPKAKSFSVGVRGALQHGSPGAWVSDHRAETDKFTGWNYVAINALAMQCAQADAKVYDDSQQSSGNKNSKMLRKAIRASAIHVSKSYGHDDKTEPLPETHPLVRLLSRPSPTQSGGTFRYEQVVQLRLTGTCLVWNVPNQAGRVCERYVIPTSVANPKRPTPEMPRGGWYVNPSLVTRWQNYSDDQGYTPAMGFFSAIGKVIPAEEVQVIRLPHAMWRDDGQSPVAAMALWSDSADQLDRARWSHFKNGPEPSIVVSLDMDGENITPEELERATNVFNQKYSGAENHGRAIFTSGKTSITPVSTSPKDMSYQEGFHQLRDATLAIHGVPGVAAGITDGGSYAAFYASLMQFTRLTVQPHLNLLAEDDARTIGPQFGENLSIELEAQHVDDPQILEAQLATDIAAGAMTINEIRAIRGYPPVDWGDVPAGKADVTGLAVNSADATPGEGDPFGDMVASQSDESNTAGSAKIDPTNLTDGNSSLATGPTGEFAGLSRQQFTRNRKAIGDVLGDLATGDISDSRAMAELSILGITDQAAQRLVDDVQNLKQVQPVEKSLNGNRVSPAIRLNGHSSHGSHNGHNPRPWLIEALYAIGEE